MERLKFDLFLQFKKRRDLGEIAYNDKEDYWVITLNRDMNFIDRVSILAHEIIHYLNEKGLIDCRDDEKVAYLVQRLIRKGVKVIIDDVLT